MGHVKDQWTRPGPSGRRVKNARHGRGKRWLARWDEGGRERSRAFATKQAAEQHLARMSVDSEAGRPAGAGSMTVAEYLHLYRSRQVHWRGTTGVQVESAFRRQVIPAIGDVLLQSLDRGMVADMIAGWTVAPSTQKVTYAHLTTALRAAVQYGLIRSNPAEGLRVKQGDGTRVVIPTTEQVEALAGAMRPRLASAVWFAAGTGVRPGEWRSLTWDRVDLDRARVRIDRQLVNEHERGVENPTPRWGPVKTPTSNRWIALTPRLVELLEQHRAEYTPGLEGLVWTTTPGTLLQRHHIAQAWIAARAKVAVGEGITWHSLRHYHASLLIAGGCSVKAVATRLGHSTPQQTLATYAHLWPEDEGRMIAAVQDVIG